MTELTVTTKLDKLWTAADKAHAKGVDAYIEFGNACAALNDAGEAQAKIAERYEMSQSAVAHAIAVGADERIISIANNQLPRAEHTLYLLTTLDDKGFKKLAKPDTTRQTVLDYKATVEAPPADPEKPAKKGRPRKTAAKPAPAPKPEGYIKIARRHGLLPHSNLSASQLKKMRDALTPMVGFEVTGSSTLEQDAAIETACLKLVAQRDVKKGKAPEEVDTSTLTKKEQSTLAKALKELQATYEVDVQKRVREEVEKRLPTEEKKRIDAAKQAVASAKSLEGVWRQRMHKVKFGLQLWAHNRRMLFSILHPDRAPEGYADKFTKAATALNRIDAEFSTVDLESWGK